MPWVNLQAHIGEFNVEPGNVGYNPAAPGYPNPTYTADGTYFSLLRPPWNGQYESRLRIIKKPESTLEFTDIRVTASGFKEFNNGGPGELYSPSFLLWYGPSNIEYFNVVSNIGYPAFGTDPEGVVYSDYPDEHGGEPPWGAGFATSSGGAPEDLYSAEGLFLVEILVDGPDPPAGGFWTDLTKAVQD